MRNTNNIRNLFNEDVTTISTKTIADAKVNAPIIHATIQCDEFTNLKANSLKDSAFADMSSSLDMTYDLLRIIDSEKPAICMLEQVVGFYKSDIYKLFSLRMRKWGYSENIIIANGSDFGSLTTRKRGYAVFTVLDSEFAFEEPCEPNTGIWDLVMKHIDDCRDITDNKSIKDGAKCGRLRSITKDSKFSPTLVKSISR